MSEYYRVWQISGLHFLLSRPTTAMASISASTSATATTFSSEESFVQSLPECFRFYWQRVRLPIQVIWTYWELDEDMRGESNPARLSLWRSIMEAKHWTQKQVCFWPVAVKRGPEQAEDLRVDVLADILKLFTPRHVLSFGEQSHAALRHYFTSFPECLPDGCTIHCLPGAEDMLPDNREAKAQTWFGIKNLAI